MNKLSVNKLHKLKPNTNIYIVLKGMGASIYLPLPSYVVADVHTLHDGRPAKVKERACQ